MPSTYTTNLGIEKIATGEQSGTWGDTTNTNLDLIDEAINGVVTITASGAGSSGSPNDLPISEGSSSNGRNKLIIFTDGGDLGADVFYQLTPNDAEKILFVRNNLTTQDLVLFQGTYNASNDIVVPNGKDMVVKFDGAGSGATVTDVFNDLRATKLDPETLAINGTDISATASELNTLDGITANTSELNVLDGITATTAELNHTDGVTSNIQTQLNGRVVETGSTGSAEIPSGTEAQRDGSPDAGYFRFNTDTTQFEGYNGSAWGSVGGGATGAGGDQVFVENDQTVTTNYTITTNKNASATGPISIDSGVTVTVPSGSRWVIL